jgi:hypothetical protein
VKISTIEKRLQNKAGNAQKRPWPLKDIHKFDRGLNKR